MEPKAVCVFCGSSLGRDAAYEQAALSLGKALADRGLVYGGGTRGLMGAVAKGCYDAGGTVHHIIPQAMVASHFERAADKPRGLANPVSFEQDSSARSVLTVTESLRERKKRMAELSAAFVALPGGWGTIEEVFEMVTLNQHGIYHKPVIALNVKGFFSALKTFLASTVEAGFISQRDVQLLIIIDEPEDKDWGRAALAAIESWPINERSRKGEGLDAKQS